MGSYEGYLLDVDIDAEGLGFNSQAGPNRTHCSQWLATAATFLRSCDAQALIAAKSGPTTRYHASLL